MKNGFHSQKSIQPFIIDVKSLLLPKNSNSFPNWQIKIKFWSDDIMRNLLIPLSFLYGVFVFIRNLLYDMGLLPSKKFKIPVISVGNIVAGGTGKTPHIEYLIRLLSADYSTAVLSRGYKRNTEGFLLVTETSKTRETGDESKQIRNKFGNITVAVCESRVNGIKNLLNQNPDLNVILLDDAFQHRRLRAGLSILLME